MGDQAHVALVFFYQSRALLIAGIWAEPDSLHGIQLFVGLRREIIEADVIVGRMPGEKKGEGVLAVLPVEKVHCLPRLPGLLPLIEKYFFSGLRVEIVTFTGPEIHVHAVAVELLAEAEALLDRDRPGLASEQVPLADISHVVARVAEALAEGIAWRANQVVGVADDGVLERILSGQQSAPIGRANRRGRDAVVEADTLRGEAVEVRRLNLPVAVAAEHIPGMLVAEDEEKIRAIGRPFRRIGSDRAWQKTASGYGGGTGFQEGASGE